MYSKTIIEFGFIVSMLDVFAYDISIGLCRRLEREANENFPSYIYVLQNKPFNNFNKLAEFLQFTNKEFP